MSSKPEADLSFVGGWVIPYRRSGFARARFSWPLGRLTIEGNQLEFSVRGPLGKVFHPTVVTREEIAGIEKVRGGALKFRCRRDDFDSIYFTTRPGRNAMVEAALRRASFNGHTPQA